MASNITTSPLWLYLGYRVALALLMTGLFFSPSGVDFLGSIHPALFAGTSIFFLTLTLASIFFLVMQITDEVASNQIAIFTDIIFIVLMMYSSGGVTSGLGMLIGVSIALSGIGLAGRHSLLFASMATLSTLILPIIGDGSHFEFMQSGLLGASFFALSLLAFQLGLRARTSDQLAESRKKEVEQLAKVNENIIEKMSVGALVIDPDLNLKLANEVARKLLNIPKKFSGRLDEIIPEWESIKDQGEIDLGNQKIKISSAEISKTGQKARIHYLEDQEAIATQAQQLKLASLGRLTASIAHEIRNPLGAISHAAQILQESKDLSDNDNKITEIIERNAQRLNSIIDNVLNISRRTQSYPEKINLYNWLTNFMESYVHDGQLSPPQLATEGTKKGVFGFFDKSQLEQVLYILFDNAKLHFDRNITDLMISAELGISKENTPYIIVSDNGPGIPPEVLNSLFEPFVTSRADGTGLGLYLARELCIANHIELRHLASKTGSSFQLTFKESSQDS